MADALCDWYPNNHRDLPWRRDREPYHIWLSEIMLQQTRVEAVKAYYERFLAEVPDIATLARLPEERLMKLWQGLGYYRRAANLKKAAEVMVSSHGGEFPVTYEEIRALPGIGDYTAGAIASLCFSMPYPAVDGNVLRVYARCLMYDEDIAKDSTKKNVTKELSEIYKTGDPETLTQSLMELGATVCVPNGAPQCDSCPLSEICLAHKKGVEQNYPKKTAKAARKIEERTVAILISKDRVAIKKRPAKGLLSGMWEFPNVLTDKKSDANRASEFATSLGANPERILMQKSYRHIFTHVEWHMTAYYFACRKMPDDLTWVTSEELRDTYAMPSAFLPFTEELKALQDELR